MNSIKKLIKCANPRCGEALEFSSEQQEEFNLGDRVVLFCEACHDLLVLEKGKNPERFPVIRMLACIPYPLYPDHKERAEEAYSKFRTAFRE